jgi:transcriptional regulator with XRE-family HTH domain
LSQTVWGGNALNPGEGLRRLREQLGLTIRDVEAASLRIAEKHGSQSYGISLSRLSDIETKGVVPSLHKLYALAVIYRRDIQELLTFYGVNPDSCVGDVEVALPEPKNTHRFSLFNRLPCADIPIELDPAFGITATTDIGRMVVRWGNVPLQMLSELIKDRKYSYAYIGTKDLTMYPLILPGSFVQVDESSNTITKKMWRSEFERPIYFIETRQGFVCSWCELSGSTLMLTSHPLSPVPSRYLRLGTEAEIIGQVVGVAMRLDGWLTHGSEQAGANS